MFDAKVSCIMRTTGTKAVGGAGGVGDYGQDIICVQNTMVTAENNIKGYRFLHRGRHDHALHAVFLHVIFFQLGDIEELSHAL